MVAVAPTSRLIRTAELRSLEVALGMGRRRRGGVVPGGAPGDDSVMIVRAPSTTGLHP